MQGVGQNYQPLRGQNDGQHGYNIGNQKPNSKNKHNRTLSNDDRVMEVEGFTDTNTNTHTPFQNKSNSLRNEGDP